MKNTLNEKLQKKSKIDASGQAAFNQTKKPFDLSSNSSDEDSDTQWIRPKLNTFNTMKSLFLVKLGQDTGMEYFSKIHYKMLRTMPICTT